jgi:glyoxylase-like metal-dependent hydrolase (beta-lactamase superfamily II)
VLVEPIKLGDVEVSRVLELEVDWVAWEEILPDITREALADNEAWLKPKHWSDETDLWLASVATYVLRSAGKTILIDTGVGNDKERPHYPPFTHLGTGYLSALAAAGVAPGDVDLVINTHLHVDHVGWNTQLVGREWVPTFPNARYYVHSADVEYWNPVNGHSPLGKLLAQNVYEDSVAPLIAAGVCEVWEGDSIDVDENLKLVLAPGHTPGSGVVELTSGSDRALFVGDTVHTPLQVLNPALHSCFDEDPVEARRSRSRVIGQAADTNALVFAAHFRDGDAASVTPNGAGFSVTEWKAFPTS